jgi:TolB-like protein
MTGESRGQHTRKLAVILHADIMDSTALVQQNETIAHDRIQQEFRLLSKTIELYGGSACEIRGDALVAEFSRASDAVSAALLFQQQKSNRNRELEDDIRPEFRIGISLGEVVIADGTVTGAGVILAQRLEQLAPAGGVVVQGTVSETVPDRLPFEFESLGEQTLKGFKRPVRAFVASGSPGTQVPDPDVVKKEVPDQRNEPASPVKYEPSIAVLPFDNISGDPEQEYFSDGITEDIITELSRFRSLSVIARSSSFTFKNKESDVIMIGDELGVDYIVEGSVRKQQDRVRITAQLVEAASGTHVWAQRYDRELQDIFDVQDEVTQMIVATVGGRLEDHRIRIRDRAGANSWSVYDLVLSAQANHYRILSSANAEARQLLDKAMEIDPDNARCHSLMGAVDLLDYTSGWTPTPENTLGQALRHGRRSIQLDNSDSLAHARLGETLIHYRKLKESRRHFEKALELNPNDSESRALYSIYLVAADNPERALAELETVRKIDPYERVWYPWLRGEALFFNGQYEEAIATPPWLPAMP